MQRLSLIVVLSALVALTNAAGNDLILGQREDGDELMEQKDEITPYLSLVETRGYYWVEDDGNHMITMIEITDILGKELGKEASVLPLVIKGGPGKPHATIVFQTAPGHGYHFRVTVYGKSTLD